MKTQKTWMTMSIPGRREDGLDTKWFAYNRITCKSLECDDYDTALEAVRQLNGSGN